MMELKAEKKTDGQTYNRTKSDQDSVRYQQKTEPDFVGSGYYPPERFVPLVAKLSHPANATQRAQLFNQLQRHYGNRYVQRVVSAYRSQNVEEEESTLASMIISKKGSGRPLEPGSQAVQRLSKSAVIQAKLQIGQPNDIYEQEADRVADAVMQMPEPEVPRQKIPQTKGNTGKTPEVTRDIESRIHVIRGGGRLLPKPVRAFFEHWFDYDFSLERLNTYTQADTLNRGLNDAPSPPNHDIFILSLGLSDESGEYDENRLALHHRSINPDGSPTVPSIVYEVLRSPGQPLDADTRTFMEPRFGYDFSRVRVHTDAKAAESARAVNALAYTVGTDVVFAAGRYTPATRTGQKLLGHELVHVLQQTKNGLMLSRQFCTPYRTRDEAQAVHAEALLLFIPAITAVFGSEVGNLWHSYLNRRRGQSLTPIVFSDPSSEIVQGFVNSRTTQERQNELADIILGTFRNRCPQLPRPNVWVDIPITRYLSTGDRNYPIDFNQVFEIPGNIAGGVGSSDAGPDFRRVSGTVSFRRIMDNTGNTTDVIMRTNFCFLVRDAVDFCPGQPGAGIEQHITVPLSRLEASGFAYDVPFEVRYTPNPIVRSLDQAIVRRCFP